MEDSKIVPLIHWEKLGLYNKDVWECYGYSEFYFNGEEHTPRFAEIRRKTWVIEKKHP